MRKILVYHSVSSPRLPDYTVSITQAPFGTISDGRSVRLFKLRNANGFEVHISEFGAALVALYARDRYGEISNVVLGFDNVAAYERDDKYLGVVVGRCAGRIKDAEAIVKGKVCHLTKNENSHHLHGGAVGFHKKIWQLVSSNENTDTTSIVLKLTSCDGEEGYPGELNCTIQFTIDNQNVLRIEYQCRTSKATIANLTHHPYFNLNDGGQTTALGHELEIRAEKYMPLDDEHIPLGEAKQISGSACDFRTARVISNSMRQLAKSKLNGFNDYFILPNTKGELALAAKLTALQSGRSLEVWTTQPGIQFYSGGYLGRVMSGGERSAYRAGHGVCLEPQNLYLPASQKLLPSIELDPAALYKQVNEYKFASDK